MVDRVTERRVLDREVTVELALTVLFLDLLWWIRR